VLNHATTFQHDDRQGVPLAAACFMKHLATSVPAPPLERCS
jgi:hypothetical protein